MRLAELLFVYTLHNPVSPQGACTSAEHRQFDFWIGTWNVVNASGQSLGTNRIERILNGCVLYESWSGATGSRGHSFNTFDPGDNKWHQTWVDSEGTTLVLAGGLINGEMVLEGERRLRDGTRQLERITWTPNADGTIRQLWQASQSSGMRWTIVFDGLYRRTP
jgi:hypothetical protein